MVYPERHSSTSEQLSLNHWTVSFHVLKKKLQGLFFVEHCRAGGRQKMQIEREIEIEREDIALFYIRVQFDSMPRINLLSNI